MADNKGKTKAAILHELESIKGLLRDEDDILILQEVIDQDSDSPHSPVSNRPMAQRDLEELHNAFQALSHTISSNSGSSSGRGNMGKQNTPPKSVVSNGEGLLNSIVQQQMHVPDQQIPQQANQQTDRLKSSINTGLKAPAKQQTSLFTAEDLDQDYFTEDAVNLEVNKSDLAYRIESVPAFYGERKPDTVNPEATQNVNGTNDYPVSTSIASINNRTTLAKASGENPFLPQHIRARLHGNNPPPLFDLSTASQPLTTTTATFAPMPAPVPNINIKISADSLPNRQNLVRAVIASVLPQIEQELRQRLQPMTEDELLHLLNQEE